MRLDQFFDSHDDARRIYDCVRAALDRAGTAYTTRVTRSQIAFRARSPFAYLWIPGRYLHGGKVAPVVLSFARDRVVESPRIKQVVHPSARVWLHHVELWEPADLDDEVRTWLLDAAHEAGAVG